MTNRPYLVSDDDILNPPRVNWDGRSYRQIPVADSSQKSTGRGAVDTSQFINQEEEDVDCSIAQTAQGYKAEINVPEPLFKFIVGRKGETKHRLEVETKTQIQVPKMGAIGPIVIKGHDYASVSSAKTRIELLADNARWKHPFTHFLSIKLATPEIVDGFIQFKNDVLDLCKGDRGIDEQIFQQPNKLHLTLGTLVLLDDNEITRASKLLHECADTFISVLRTDGALNVDVEGLEYMNDDPNNVDVLYAKVCVTDQSDRLQELSDTTVAQFVNAGFMERQYDRVKLHCTVMNSVFRTDHTGMRAAETSDESERQAFDADQLLKKLGNFHFGNLDVDCLHISTRYTTDKDGYYRPAAKINF